MFLSNPFTGLLILVTIFSCSIKSTWCASLVTSDSTQNLNGNQNVQPRNSSPSQTVSSSYSITPSYAYQFYTNDNEHLDRLVLAHQNPSSSSVASSIDLNGSPNPKIISSVNPPASSFGERRMDEAKSATDLPVASSSNSAPYAGFDFSAYQQGLERERGPDFLSATRKAVISQGNDYLAQEGLLKDYSMRGKSASSPATALHKPITIIKSEQVRPSNSSVYSTRLPTGPSPITNQGQHKVQTAASYSSPVLPPMRKVEGDADKSTFAFAPARLQRKRPVEKRKILQSRQDTVELVADDDTGAGDASAGLAGAGGEGAGVGYEADEDEDHLHYYDHDGDDHYGHSHGHGQGALGQSESYDHDHDHDEHDDMMSNDGDNGYGYYADNGNGGANDLVELHDNDPAIRDFGQGGGGGPFVGGDHVPIGVGAGVPGPPGLPPPGFPGPLPPPPVPLKGSIDYILIPLILIGLAGPIFVVLYVILGGFEYRLAPIVRRSLETSYVDYEPYINAVTTSVGRALDKYECIDYATCRLRGFCNQVGLDNATTSSIETVLNSMTPKNYKPTLNSLFSVLKTPDAEKSEDCRQYKCAVLADKLPL